jgi:hypothetical protein
LTPSDINADTAKTSADEMARLQLDRILQSESFRGSESMRHLLSFLADRFLSGESDQLKEYSIGIDALGKPSSYDPRSDSTVRVQIGRLRQKLAEYYSAEGAADPVLVEIPKGQLRLVCRPIPSKPASAAPDIPAVPNESERTPDWRRRATVFAAVAAAAFILATLLGFFLWREARDKARLGTAWSSDLERLWAPFLATNRPLKISFESPMFIALDARRLFRDTSVNQWKDALSSPEIAAVSKALKSPEFQPRYHYAPFQEVSSAFLLGKLLAARKPQASLIRSNQFSWEQMANTNWLFIGSPAFFREVLEGIPVDRQFVLEELGVRNVRPKTGEPGFFADGHSRGTSSPLGFSEDGEVYAVVTNAPGPAPNSNIRSFESNITSGRLGAVQWFTDEALASILVDKLSSASGSLPQYYQVLLRVKYKDAVPVETSYVLHSELRMRSTVRK